MYRIPFAETYAFGEAIAELSSNLWHYFYNAEI